MNYPRRRTEPIAGWLTNILVFVSFFRTATPINEIADLHVGNRPGSRKTSDRIEDLRAIPWVFSWSLARIMLPGWFGFGTAVDAFLAHRGTPGMDLLREMYRNMVFFRHAPCPSNMDMVLFKSDIHIASRYAELVSDSHLREDVFGRIRREMQRAIEHLLVITGQKELLESNPSLARSFRNRDTAISTRSTTFRWKHSDAIDPAVSTNRINMPYLLTINGIAAGLRNSG